MWSDAVCEMAAQRCREVERLARADLAACRLVARAPEDCGKLRACRALTASQLVIFPGANEAGIVPSSRVVPMPLKSGRLPRAPRRGG